jgi:hypothetical protein
MLAFSGLILLHVVVFLTGFWRPKMAVRLAYTTQPASTLSTLSSSSAPLLALVTCRPNIVGAKDEICLVAASPGPEAVAAVEFRKLRYTLKLKYGGREWCGVVWHSLLKDVRPFCVVVVRAAVVTT